VTSRCSTSDCRASTRLEICAQPREASNAAIIVTSARDSAIRLKVHPIPNDAVIERVQVIPEGTGPVKGCC